MVLRNYVSLIYQNANNMKAINTSFNTIETIRTDKTIANTGASYLAACDDFEAQASQFAANENFVSRKSAEEVSLAYQRAKNADCEFMVYRHALAAEIWLSKAWNNAD